MSLGDRGVCQLLKEVAWSLHCGVLIVLLNRALQAALAHVDTLFEAMAVA